MSKKILETVLTVKFTKDIWGSGYKPAHVITIQDFSMGGVLPTVLYMMRRGHRRGKGNFSQVFGTDSGPKARSTIDTVAQKLLEHKEWFRGFDADEPVHSAIFGDLLLASALENKKHETGRDKLVQRVYPAHYFASWVDLPIESANLRFVPELITNILSRSGHFALKTGFEENLLLSSFGVGTYIVGDSADDLKSDRFDESTTVGIDQLLTIRLGQALDGAPRKLRGKEPEILNQNPVSTRACDIFCEDFSVFLRAYGRIIPRLSLVQMLESALSLGLSSIFGSALKLTVEWGQTGKVTSVEHQTCWPFFVDCSGGTSNSLRRFAEESFDRLVEQCPYIAEISICLRILDYMARSLRLKGVPDPEPDPAPRMDYLGRLLTDQTMSEYHEVKLGLKMKCNDLLEVLDEAEHASYRCVLEDESTHPARKLAEVVCLMMNRQKQGYLFAKCMDSCLMVDVPNGFAAKRYQKKDRRSIRLSNTALDYIVHRHLIKANKNLNQRSLSLGDILCLLQDNYGFFIDEAPPGMSIPSETLQTNRHFFERRLRDLGLLIGVNDAESMKRLQQRYLKND